MDRKKVGKDWRCLEMDKIQKKKVTSWRLVFFTGHANSCDLRSLALFLFLFLFFQGVAGRGGC